MPRIRPAARSTRVSRNTATTPLRRYAKPRNMDRLLAALYEAFQESGSTWISVEVLLRKIEEQAQTLDDTLGKKFGPYSRSCLSALRRNSYVEAKISDSNDDEVRITEYMKEIFEKLMNDFPTFGDQSATDVFRLKCDYLRREIQPKSRRLPTRAELDRENVLLSQKNRELVEEHAELESELNLLKQSPPNLGAVLLPVLRREATEPIIQQLESGFTDSMYTDPVSQAPVSVQPPRPIPEDQIPVLAIQSLSKQNTMQTPARASAPSVVGCYPTPESAPRNNLGRQNSHLLSPPASPSSRRSPPAYTMPGALTVEGFGAENDGEGEPQENGGGMDIDDEDDDDEQIMTRPCTPGPVGVDNHDSIVFPTSGFSPVQTFPNCARCANHQNQVDSTTIMNPVTTACQGCESKTKIIESNETVISKLQGNLKDHKSLIDDLQDLILEKIKKIRELTSSS